jgi:DNA repair photolyase
MTTRDRFRGHVLYEPSGRALETARFIVGGVKPIIVCNTTKTCSHMCDYCYCPQVLKVTKEQFFRPSELKDRILERFEKDIVAIDKRNDFNPKALYMSFVGDPFTNGRADIQDMTTLIMKKALLNNLEICTLTKGAYLVDKIHYEPVYPNWYGISVVSLDEEFRKAHEPGTEKFSRRTMIAGEMFNAGSNTWASMEPWPVPSIHKQSVLPVLTELRDVAHVSKIIFGKWNYDKRTVGAINDRYYFETALTVVGFCKDNGIAVKVKDDILNKVTEEDRKELM